jgi:hypothetical protein
VLLANNEGVISEVPVASKTMVWFGPPFSVYVTIAFGVPVKVTVAEVPGQMVVVPEIVAVGKGITSMVAEPDSDCVQLDVPFEVTLTKV